MPERLSWLYVLLIALWLLLRALFSDGIWWLALANTAAVYLFLPLPALLAAALWRRRWPLLIGSALPAVAFAALYGALFLPRFQAPHAQGPAIVATTFNVLASNKDIDAIIRSIRALRPDVIGLQELTSGKRAALQEDLRQEYPYYTLATPDQFGNAGLISRFPIERVAAVPLPTQQPALHAVLRVVDGRRLHVFVAHLSPNHLFKDPAVDLQTAASSAYARRAAEVARLNEEIGALDEPAILLCDCNLTDTSQAYAELRELLHDSFREAGWGLGHTSYVNGSPVPMQRIDYVWHTAELVATTARVGEAGGSDHLPVVATLRFAR